MNATNQAELFEAPFNLRGELIDNGPTVEGERRATAQAQSETNKAQLTLNPVEKRLTAGTSPIAAFLTEATCGEACWEAREDVCRCCCGGKNHGCMRTADGIRPTRNCKLDGIRRELAGVGGDVFNVAKEMNKAAGVTFIFAAQSHDQFSVDIPAKLRTATDSQVANWPELAAWRDGEAWTDEKGKRHFLDKPSLLWVKVNKD